MLLIDKTIVCRWTLSWLSSWKYLGARTDLWKPHLWAQQQPRKQTECLEVSAGRLGRQNWVPHLQKMGLPNLESKVYSGMTWTAAGSLIEVKHRNTWPRGISCCQKLLCPGTQEEAAHHMALLSISLPQDAMGAQTSPCFQGHPQHLTYTTLLLSDPFSKPRCLTKLSKKIPDL